MNVVPWGIHSLFPQYLFYLLHSLYSQSVFACLVCLKLNPGRWVHSHLVYLTVYFQSYIKIQHLLLQWINSFNKCCSSWFLQELYIYVTRYRYATASARSDGMLLLCGGRDISGTVYFLYFSHCFIIAIMISPFENI